MSDCLFLKQDNTVKTVVERSKERINPDDVAVLYIQNTGKHGKRKFIWGPLLKNEDNKNKDIDGTGDSDNQQNAGSKSSVLESYSKAHSINLSSFTTSSTPNSLEVSEPTTSLNNTGEGLLSLISPSPLNIMRKTKSGTKSGIKEIQDKIIQDRIIQDRILKIIQDSCGATPDKCANDEILKCHICNFKPKSQKRAPLYSHYGRNHFRDKILQLNCSETQCAICNKQFESSNQLIVHVSVVHCTVEQFIPESFHFKERERKTISANYVNEPANTATIANCQLCNFIPKTTKVRTELYTHYGTKHFRADILQEFGSDKTVCPLCNDPNKSFASNYNFVKHLSHFHRVIEKYLPEQYHIKGKKIEKLDKKTEIISKNSCEEENRNEEISPDRSVGYKCYICNFIPGNPSKKSLYGHYGAIHFKQQLLNEHGDSPTCVPCKKDFLTQTHLLQHLSSVHNKVEKYIPEQFRISSPENPEAKIGEKKIPIEKCNLCSGPLDNGLCSEKCEKFSCFKCNFSLDHPTRKLVYIHFATCHFHQEIISKFEDTICSLCSSKKRFKSQLSLLYHLALFHNEVEKYLPKEHHVFKQTSRDASSVKAKVVKCDNKKIGLKSMLDGSEKVDKFKCRFEKCQFVPRFRKRIEMYGHYGIEHFRANIEGKFGKGTKCNICEKDFVLSYKILTHYAYVHAEVENYLPAKYHISREEQCVTPENRLLLSNQLSKGININKQETRNRDEYKNKFKCFRCNYEPRIKNKSKMYEHYVSCIKEYQAAAKKKFISTVCVECKKDLSNKISYHMGIVHNEIEQFIPDAYRITKRDKNRKVDTTNSTSKNSSQENNTNELNDTRPNSFLCDDDVAMNTIESESFNMVDESLVADFLSNNQNNMKTTPEEIMLDTLDLLKDRGINVSASQTFDNSPETSNMSTPDVGSSNKNEIVDVKNTENRTVEEKETTEIFLEEVTKSSDDESEDEHEIVLQSCTNEESSDEDSNEEKHNTDVTDNGPDSSDEDVDMDVINLNVINIVSKIDNEEYSKASIMSTSSAKTKSASSLKSSNVPSACRNLQISPTNKMFHSINLLLGQDCKRKRKLLPPKKFLENEEKTYCICKKPYKKSHGSMIGCDGPCENWFHFKCLKISDDFISRANWFCKQCFVVVTGKEACICGSGWKPNEELLQCTGDCRIWFHPRCQGLDTEYTAKLGTWKKFSKSWKCKFCTKQTISKQDSTPVKSSPQKKLKAMQSIRKKVKYVKTKIIPDSKETSLSIVKIILGEVLQNLEHSSNKTIVQRSVATPDRIRISPTSKMFKSVTSLLDCDTKSKRIVMPPKRFLDGRDSISTLSTKHQGHTELQQSTRSSLCNTEKVYCICRKPYAKSDPPMIGCDGPCKEWFHFPCIGIPDHFISRAAWYCKTCFTEMTGTGEACVCGGRWRPDQELLRCQGECKIWYHPQCKNVDTEFCNKLGTWKKFSKSWKCDLCMKSSTANKK